MRTIGFGIFAMAACLSCPASVTAKVFVYPQKGQSTEQQKKDSYECYEWAKTQSGVDPSAAPAPSSGRPGPPGPNGALKRRKDLAAQEAKQKEAGSAYDRAFGACMQGRGYSVR
jgi:hypothetical protein